MCVEKGRAHDRPTELDWDKLQGNLKSHLILFSRLNWILWADIDSSEYFIMDCNTLKKGSYHMRHMNAVENDPAHAAGLNIKDYTDASLKFVGTFEFNAPPRDIWPMVTDANNIAKWFPIIYAGNHAKGTAKTEESCDVGSKRMCKTIGMGTLDETFLYFDPLKVSAYSLKNPIMPVKDHAAIMYLEEFEPGKTRMTWSHYFNYRGLLQRHFFPFMMTMFMNMGMKKLARTVGGDGGRMRAV